MFATAEGVLDAYLRGAFTLQICVQHECFDRVYPVRNEKERHERKEIFTYPIMDDPFYEKVRQVHGVCVILRRLRAF